MKITTESGGLIRRITTETLVITGIQGQGRITLQEQLYNHGRTRAQAPHVPVMTRNRPLQPIKVQFGLEGRAAQYMGLCAELDPHRFCTLHQRGFIGREDMQDA